MKSYILLNSASIIKRCDCSSQEKLSAFQAALRHEQSTSIPRNGWSAGALQKCSISSDRTDAGREMQMTSGRAWGRREDEIISKERLNNNNNKFASIMWYVLI